MSAILGLFELIPRWLLLAVIVALGAVACVERSHNKDLKVEISALNTTIALKDKTAAELEAARSRVAAEASDAYRVIEKMRTTRAMEIQNAILAERESTAAAVAAARKRDGVFNAAVDKALATVGRGGGTANDPAALTAASEAAAALRDVLASCRSGRLALARETEDLASQVRGLISAYASLQPAQQAQVTSALVLSGWSSPTPIHEWLSDSPSPESLWAWRSELPAATALASDGS